MVTQNAKTVIIKGKVIFEPVHPDSTTGDPEYFMMQIGNITGDNDIPTLGEWGLIILIVTLVGMALLILLVRKRKLDST